MNAATQDCLICERVRASREGSNPYVTPELMRAGAAVQATFQPWNLNYCCYGNADPHVDWHIFPRYADDLNRGDPWREAARFPEREIEEDEARRLASTIRANL